MPRKKVVPEENPEQVNDMEMEAQAQEEGVEQLPADVPQEEASPPAAGEEAHQSDPPPKDTDTPPAEPPAEGLDTGQSGEADTPPVPPPLEEPVDIPEEASAMKPFWMEPSTPPPPPPEPEPPIPQKSDRQSFYDLDFNALDRDLTAEERQEWNSIYASYRGRSALTGTIIGVDPLHITVRNRETGAMEKKTMYCAIVVPYSQRHDLIRRVCDVQLIAVTPGHPLFADGNNGAAAPGDFVLVCHKFALDLPAQSFDAVSGENKGKFLFDLGDLFTPTEDIVSRQEAPHLLLDKCGLVSRHVINMELLPPGKHFALDDVFIVSVLVFDGELVAPGKHLFFYVELHCNSLLLDTIT